MKKQRFLAKLTGACLFGTTALALNGAVVSVAAADITLVGASQFDENHVFTRNMRKFEELVTACYTDEPIIWEMHLNSELGLEKDYVAFMNQGLSVDYAVASPAHMSTFSQMAPLMDMPFLFRDADHWRKVLDADALKPVADDILEKADIRLLGYGGGGTRNIFAARPVTNMAELADLSIRMQGAPIWTSVFDALGAAPTVIAYNEVYNGIQTGVIEAGENEAAGVEQMKFYEVGPHLSLTEHAITIRPLFISNKTYQRLPEALQQCIDQAGPEAGKFAREAESKEDAEKIQVLVDQGFLTTHEFTERERMIEAATPVIDAYADDLGALDVLKAVQAIQ